MVSHACSVSHGGVQISQITAIAPSLASATRAKRCFLGLSSRRDAVYRIVDTISSERRLSSSVNTDIDTCRLTVQLGGHHSLRITGVP